jgi:hypothetical protein
LPLAQAHIRKRFEECKRVAVHDGESPNSPLLTYAGFDPPLPSLATLQ